MAAWRNIRQSHCQSYNKCHEQSSYCWSLMFVSPLGMLSVLGVILKQSETRHLRCQSEGGASQLRTRDGIMRVCNRAIMRRFLLLLFLQQMSIDDHGVVLGTFFSSSISSNLVSMRLRNAIRCLRHPSHCSRSWYYYEYNNPASAILIVAFRHDHRL